MARHPFAQAAWDFSEAERVRAEIAENVRQYHIYGPTLAQPIRRERCAGSGHVANGHGHLCACGQIFVAPRDSQGSWTIPEHDGECSW